MDFKRLFESAPGLYLVLSPSLIIQAASDAYLAATMTAREDIVGRGLFEVFPDNPNDPNATGVSNLRASLMRVIAGGGPDTMAVQKYDVQRPDSQGGGFEERYWSPLNSPVTGPDGRLLHIIHRVEDVTEYVHLTEILKTRTGQMEMEILRRSKELHEVNRELRTVQADLETRVAERTSELMKAHDQMRQVQKMEAIGTLAGGVAHDFNNLLTVICGCTDMLLAEGLQHEEATDLLQQVHASGIRAAALTRQLLAFSRQQVLDPRLIDVNVMVADADKLLQRLIGEDVSLITRLQPALPRIKADPGQIEQIVLNLAVNARDAMPQGGQLTIETSTVTLAEAPGTAHQRIPPGDYVVMTVTDTGIGMDEATRARIFEPFFTTKGVGKGTGLGLSSVFGIVKQSGGHIWVYSEVGSGTSFKIYLPVAAGPGESPSSARDHVMPTGTETVLVAEDEPAVREFTVLALRSLGYTVIECANGTDAISRSRAYPAHIDILVSDVVMPGLGGRLAADAIVAQRPDIKVLFLSGYTDDSVVRHGILEDDVAFLQKPFTRQALAAKVREVLCR